MCDSEVPEDRIEVGVVDCWLTLDGEVKHQYESNAAFEAVSGVPGVGGITNESRSSPPASTADSRRRFMLRGAGLPCSGTPTDEKEPKRATVLHCRELATLPPA